MKILNQFLIMASFLAFAKQSVGQELPVLNWAVGTSNNPSQMLLYSSIVDANGNSFISGFFSGTADFDPGLAVVNLTAVGGRDIFVVKIDVDGNFAWVKTIGGTNDDEPRELAVDASGNIYMVGGFNNTVDFDPGPGVVNLTSSGGSDGFVLKLTNNGDFVWAKQLDALILGMKIHPAVALVLPEYFLVRWI